MGGCLILIQEIKTICTMWNFYSSLAYPNDQEKQTTSLKKSHDFNSITKSWFFSWC